MNTKLSSNHLAPETTSFFWENHFTQKGFIQIAGIDEAGRGALVGPVYAACVILEQNCGLEELTDSKKLTPKKREILAQKIKKEATAFGIGFATHQEIDKYNVLKASLLAMQRAIDNCSKKADFILVDGNQKIPNQVNQECLIKGDFYSVSIAAASILAKVSRDEWMLQLHQKMPHYEFDKHKGYGTKKHLNALEKHGPSIYHRFSFAPVRLAQK